MRILLTGGAGFIGSHLLERLLRQKHEVTIVDDFDDYYDPAAKRLNVRTTQAAGMFGVVEADIRDREAMARAFESARPEALIHLAARAGVRPSLENPELYQAVNVAGTLTLLEECRQRGVKKVLFASSSSVYGDTDRVPFCEDDASIRPASPYGVTKLIGEHYGAVYHRLFGLRVTALRFFSVYGPRQRPDMAIRKFAELMVAGQELPVYGDGRSQRDYTYIDDIVDGIMGALGRDGGFEVYNLGESRTVSLSEMIELLEKELGIKAKIRRLPPQAGDVQRTYADVSKARANLGYAPRVPIEEGIRRFVAWLRSR
ncbi:MAG: GDP-mannose 4,6-dehydratase [Planctomycetes bacterium]|nr:GDP-mannose 4,6-dehydratase [Planctomycetota bacterium]